MSDSIAFCLVVTVCVTFMPLVFSLADYFTEKAVTERRNRGDKTLFERWREKRKSK